MFNFMRGSGMRAPSGAIRQALEADSLPPGMDVSTLGVVQSSGRYSQRKVTYFRVFDPTRAVARSVDVTTGHAYEDLNAHLDLVLRAGFVERDGTVILFSRPAAPNAEVPSRERADRAAHADDERVVFPSQGG